MLPLGSGLRLCQLRPAVESGRLKAQSGPSGPVAPCASARESYVRLSESVASPADNDTSVALSRKSPLPRFTAPGPMASYPASVTVTLNVFDDSLPTQSVATTVTV